MHDICPILWVLFSIYHIWLWRRLVSSLKCPRLFQQHIWTILNRNIHTCYRSGTKKDEGDILQYNYIHSLSYFTRKTTETRTDFLWRFIMGYVDIFFHSEFTRNALCNFSSSGSSGSVATEKTHKHHNSMGIFHWPFTNQPAGVNVSINSDCLNLLKKQIIVKWLFLHNFSIWTARRKNWVLAIAHFFDLFFLNIFYGSDFFLIFVESWKKGEGQGIFSS